MPDQPPSSADLQQRLHQLSELLRQSRNLDPEAQEELAKLVDELGRAVHPGAAPPPQAAELAETVEHLTRALKRPHDKGLLTGARERLEEAAFRMEEEAPMATGILQRIIAALADLGI